jgi:hypothetical protein
VRVDFFSLPFQHLKSLYFQNQKQESNLLESVFGFFKQTIVHKTQRVRAMRWSVGFCNTQNKQESLKNLKNKSPNSLESVFGSVNRLLCIKYKGQWWMVGWFCNTGNKQEHKTKKRISEKPESENKSPICLNLFLVLQTDYCA